MDYAQWGQPLARRFSALVERLGDHLPDLLGAAALLLVGWILARLLGGWTRRLIGRVDRIAPTRGVQGALRRLGVERPAAEMIGAVVFWIVLLFFVTGATEMLGLPVLSTWLAGLAKYLPRLLLALLILFAGFVASTLARDAIVAAAGAAGLTYGGFLGAGTQAAILLVAGMTAVDQAGLDSRFLSATVTLLVGAVAGGMALAFGLGARTAVSNIIACHYLRKSYRVGHLVRIGPVQGRIIEITTNAVVLVAADTRVLVPAKEFSEGISALVTTGG